MLFFLYSSPHTHTHNTHTTRSDTRTQNKQESEPKRKAERPQASAESSAEAKAVSQPSEWKCEGKTPGAGSLRREVAWRVGSARGVPSGVEWRACGCGLVGWLVVGQSVYSAEPSLEPVSCLRVSFVPFPFLRVCGVFRYAAPHRTDPSSNLRPFLSPERRAPRTLVTPGPSLPQPSASLRSQRLPSVPGQARACVSLSSATTTTHIRNPAGARRTVSLTAPGLRPPHWCSIRVGDSGLGRCVCFMCVSFACQFLPPLLVQTQDSRKNARTANQMYV